MNIIWSDHPALPIDPALRSISAAFWISLLADLVIFWMARGLY